MLLNGTVHLHSLPPKRAADRSRRCGGTKE